MLLLVIAAGAFLLGALCAELNRPPISWLRSAYHSIRGPDHDDDKRPGPEGTRFRFARSRAQHQLTPAQQESMEELRALGYLSGTTPATTEAGVTFIDPERSFAGVNLLCDGHDSAAELRDMTGQLLHRWTYRFEKAFPDARQSPRGARGTKYWRRVALLPEGRLLAIYEGQGLVELDRDSNLIWAYPGWAHHDLEVHADGKISVLTREVALLPRINADEPVMHDWIVVLDADGRVLDRISILEAIEASDFRGLLDLTRKKGDLFHTNTLELLDGTLSDRLPAFAAGNYLISLRTINTIAIVDVQSRRVTWAMTGLWEAQHQPTVLPTGDILIFDNKGAPGGSRVVEFDPVTQTVHWQFDEDGALDSPTCGSVQRLPDGNTLITESETGRALEVTTDGELVWEYLTPYRAGSEDELVATLFEVQRLSLDTDVEWVKTQ